MHEPESGIAKQILLDAQKGAYQLLAPPHWIAEVFAVIDRQRPARLTDSADVIYGINIQMMGGRMIHMHAAKLSTALNHHLFETHYHAVAIACDATLITADERYFEKANGLGNIILLHHFKAD